MDLLEYSSSSHTTHHASAVAIVARGNPGARLGAASVTSRAGVVNVHAQVFIGTLNRLQKCELHHELQKRKRKEAELLANGNT